MSKTAHKTLLVIALSSRPLVEAAHAAGFKVMAIDGFADSETRALAEQVSLVAFSERGFAADALMTVIHALHHADYIGFIYGAGFEAQPELLQAIAEKIPLIGNEPAVITRLKSMQFFSRLANLEIPHPRTFIHPKEQNITLQTEQSLLRKYIWGSGGTHIQCGHLPSSGQVNDGLYFQEFIAGTPVSLLFIAHARKIEIVGFNEQWLSPSAAMPFRYGGAVNHVELPAIVKQQLIRAAEQLTSEYRLKGLNSIDAIVHHAQAYILELNPRLSATFDLYADKGTNLKRHIHACRDDSWQLSFEVEDSVNRAHAIVYATKDIFIPEDFDWPEWAVDTPAELSANVLHIKGDAPVCTVLAIGDNSHEAKQLAVSRVKIMHTLLAAFDDKQPA